MPDESGWDVNATAPIVLAEDFMCTKTGFIKDIHFWGSWKNGIPGQIQYFILSLHSDIPVGPTTPYSRPGALLWERRITNFLIKQIDPPTSEGWYDPSTGEILPNNHQQYFQYNVFLDQADWFAQDSGKIYWLNISAVLQPGPVPVQWGWKSTQDRWNDDAVWDSLPPGFPCISPDNGFGTAWQPSMCRYLPNNEVMKIIDGLPPGDVINIETELLPLSLSGESPGGGLGGTQSQSHMQLNWHMTGAGSLAGFARDVTIDLPTVQTDQAPRVPGTSPQSFDTDMKMLQGQLPPGDPDFDLLRITAGTGFGMPSPGHTTLTSAPGGWNVESFFDITYRIDFVGAPGGPLAGRSGSTTATIRLSQGAAPMSWSEMHEPQVILPPVQNTYQVAIDPNGQFAGGGGSEPYGDGWYTYPSQWINIWFYDHPFDTSRYKRIHLEFDLAPFTPLFPSVIEFAVNWSTDRWSLQGNPPGPRRPPLPGEDEGLYIGRTTLHQSTVPSGHYVFDYIIPDYNPEWVSIDVRGRNFVVQNGFIIHECLPSNPPPSLGLAFVITNGGATTPTGACCYPNTFGSFDCTVTTQTNCVNNLNGIYQGDNTTCLGVQACCLPSGNCVMVDVLCCQAMGGQPQPAGTSCTQPQACCLPSGQCAILDPVCCIAAGGQPQPVGTTCTQPQACCLPSGQCVMLDPVCCTQQGGQPMPGVICQANEACCLPSGGCIDVDPTCCRAMGGVPQGPGTNCATVSCGGQPEACCLQNGACVMMTPTSCQAAGGTPQGAGTTCSAPEACCLPNGQCADLDPLCCTNLGGIPQGPGSKCTAPQVCCLPNGQCIFVDPLCCDEYQGRLRPTAQSCTIPKVCCCMGITGNVDCDPANGIDISDLAAMIDYLYISFTPLCCPDEANTDGDAVGGIDISDLAALIDYLYISFTPVANCR
jgi:hypothetical protein